MYRWFLKKYDKESIEKRMDVYSAVKYLKSEAGLIFIKHEPMNRLFSSYLKFLDFVEQVHNESEQLTSNIHIQKKKRRFRFW